MDLDALTKEMSWVRRLAGAIVKDDALADDVAQDAWLVASAHAPADRPLRPWLHRVVTNLARMRGRSAARRQARELATELPAVATPAELAERVATQRAVADEVLALAEPYRTVVLLFYVEGVPTREIAERLQIPDGTVRRRLKVARDELKSKLAKAGLMAALVALATSRDATAATTAVGALAMKKVIAAVVVLVMLLGGGAVWWWTRGGRGDDATTAAASSEVSKGRRAAGDRDAGTLRLPSWLGQSGVASRRIAGRVVSGGVPVPAAVVRLGLDAMELAVVAADKDGRFDLGIQPALAFEVSAEATGFAPASLAVRVADPTAKPDQLVLDLAACRTRLFGTVVDASGGGIAKAHLATAGLGGTDTDAAGAYSLCLGEDTTVRVDADGYGAIDVPFRFHGEIRHDFALVPEGILGGRVVTVDDRPVPNARLMVEPDSSEEPHQLATHVAFGEPDGTFKLAGLVPGRYRLFARADRLGTSTPMLVIATTGRSATELRVVVSARARITGRVLRNGAPVAGALVRPSTYPESSTTSQADGTFVLDGVRFGSTGLTAAPYSVAAPRALVVDRESIDGVIVEVVPSPVVRGRVTRRGHPVANATVSCHRSQVTDATSGANGDYALVIPGPAGNATPCDLDAVAIGSERAVSRTVHVMVASDTTVDLELDAGGSIAGTVVDEAGMPVEGVHVIATTGDDSGVSVTNARGEFACVALRGGDYRISVYPSPAAQAAFDPIGERPAIHLASGDSAVDGVRVAIRHTELAIRGRVVDDTGATVSDVQIIALGRSGQLHDRSQAFAMPQTIADGNGSFVIDHLAPGTYALYAHAGGGSEAMLHGVVAGSANVKLELARAGSVNGELLGFDGMPIVLARNATHPDLLRPIQGVVDGTRFSFGGLPPGRYSIEATGTQTWGQDGVLVDITPGATQRVTLTARSRAWITGTVVDAATKAPIGPLSCWTAMSLGGNQGGLGGGSSTDPPVYPAAGQFRLNTPIGHIRASCTVPGYGDTGTDVDVVAGTSATVELRAVKTVSPPSDVGFDIAPKTLPPIVMTVDPKGPAATALAIGDRILSIDGQSVATTLGAMTLAHNHRPGAAMTLVIVHDGAQRAVEITARAF